ncbi:MAG: hypothetical protein Roseis2KO_32150 [Roseivirga sp.]
MKQVFSGIPHNISEAVTTGLSIASSLKDDGEIAHNCRLKDYLTNAYTIRLCNTVAIKKTICYFADCRGHGVSKQEIAL